MQKQTAKSCGPGACNGALSLCERVTVRASDGGKEPYHQGERGVSRHIHCAGRPDVPTEPVVSLARALKRCRAPGRLKGRSGPDALRRSGLRVQRAPGLPAPSQLRGRQNERQNSDKCCRENAGTCPRVCCLIFEDCSTILLLSFRDARSFA